MDRDDETRKMAAELARRCLGADAGIAHGDISIRVNGTEVGLFKSVMISYIVPATEHANCLICGARRVLLKHSRLGVHLCAHCAKEFRSP